MHLIFGFSRQVSWVSVLVLKVTSPEGLYLTPRQLQKENQGFEPGFLLSPYNSLYKTQVLFQNLLISALQ